jgi:hypothetical protein
MAEVTNFAITRTGSVSGFLPELASRRELSQTEGALLVYVLLSNRPIFISQVEDTRDNDSNPNADGKENPVGGKSDEDCNHDCGSNQQPSRAFDANRHSVKKILAR